MIFRLLRLFFLRFLPGRLFAIVSLLEFALMARRFYKSTTTPKRPIKPVSGPARTPSSKPSSGGKQTLRPVGPDALDDDER